MKFILAIIFILFIFSNNGCHHVKDPIVIKDTIDTTIIVIPKVLSVRDKLIDSINKQLYVRETSTNRGPMVDIYLKEVGSSLGLAWCAGFVGSNLTWQNVENPKSAWSPNYARTKDIIWMPKKKNSIDPLPGDVVTFYYTNIGRVGHVGFFESKDKDNYFITVEGNTNTAGSNEGDGVYKKKRDPNKVHAVSRYIKSE